MKEPILNRRDLNRLALAALGGLVSGALIGCGPPPRRHAAAAGDKPGPATSQGRRATPGKSAPADTPLLLQDPHVCRGINTCKNKGKNGTMNECAGQGHCATVKAHSCQGMNDCKGQGGCGENPGENECKGKGGCAVPLDAGKKMTWQKARKRFEELMKKASGKKFGDAPAALDPASAIRNPGGGSRPPRSSDLS